MHFNPCCRRIIHYKAIATNCTDRSAVGVCVISVYRVFVLHSSLGEAKKIPCIRWVWNRKSKDLLTRREKEIRKKINQSYATFRIYIRQRINCIIFFLTWSGYFGARSEWDEIWKWHKNPANGQKLELGGCFLST